MTVGDPRPLMVMVVYENQIIVGNVYEIAAWIPDGWLNVIILSPPYYGVRDYNVQPVILGGPSTCDHAWEVVDVNRKFTPGDLPGPNAKVNHRRSPAENRPGKPSMVCTKCHAYQGDLGNEPTLDGYVSHLCDLFDILRPKLRDDGVIFLNIGDSYGGSGGAGGDWQKGNKANEAKWRAPDTQYPDRCLMMIPARVAIEMVNRGWVVRNDIIWQKPDPKPESTPDRFTNDHEYVFFITKEVKPRFYSNTTLGIVQREKPPGIHGEEGRDWRWKPHHACGGTGIVNGGECKRCKGTGRIRGTLWRAHAYYFRQMKDPLKHPNVKGGHNFGGTKFAGYGNNMYSGNEYDATRLDGRNMRATWQISTSRYKGGHYATWPTELVRRMLRAGCPRKICTACGLPVLPKARCTCNAPTRPGRMFDPFNGVGTSTKVAKQMGFTYLGCELNPEYAAQAEYRVFYGRDRKKPRAETIKIDKNQTRLTSYIEGETVESRGLFQVV